MSLSKKVICQEIEAILIEASQMAALSASKLVGSGKKNEADDLAVKAMRQVLQGANYGMEVVIGEGEMDEAPMLYIGEKFGTGEILFEIAVDPLEGTNLCAKNLPNSITTIAISEKGGFLKAPDCYMQKIASGHVSEEGVLHIESSLRENLINLAKYRKKEVNELEVIMLERERHKEQIDEARSMGVRVSLIPDGDIYGIIATTSFGNGADLYIGYGGAPEGVLAGAVIKACNGFMMGKLHYTTNEQKERAVQYGLSNPNQILTLKDIVSKNCIFVASGVTNGEMLKGAKFCKKRGMNRVETIVFKSIEGIPFVSKSINYTKP